VFPVRSDVLSMGEIAIGDVIFVGSDRRQPKIQANSARGRRVHPHT